MVTGGSRAARSGTGGDRMDGWCLEGLTVNGDSTLLPMLRFPLWSAVIRPATSPSPLPETSRQHARIEQDVGGLLRLTDLNSGNGTFVNRAPIHGSVLIRDGDVLHFGVTEYRLRRMDERLLALAAPPEDMKTVIVGRGPGAERTLCGGRARV